MEKKTYPTEVLDITIERLDERGYGYNYHIHEPEKGSEGKKLNIFVTNVVPGDVVRVSIKNAKGRGFMCNLKTYIKRRDFNVE